MFTETEKTILNRGKHWSCFAGAAAALALAAAGTALKSRPPGVILTMLPFIRTISAAKTLMWTEWAVIALLWIAGLKALVRNARVRYIITESRLIRQGSGRETGYLDIPEIHSARIDGRSPSARTRGLVKRGDVILKSDAGTHVLRDVYGPESFVRTLAEIHDGRMKPLAEEKRTETEYIKKAGHERGNVKDIQSTMESNNRGDTQPERNGSLQAETEDNRMAAGTPSVITGKSPMEELDSLIGLSSVKEEVRSLRNFIAVQKMRRNRGLPPADISLHTVFTGNPGTGKTTVARIMASIFRETGILPRGHLVEVDRSGLVAEYVGQTAAKTNRAVDSAIGGVLFIDEAYSLTEGGNNDYGQEAVATLLKRMEDDRGRFAVILAGYTENMAGFLESNPGLKSRFPRTIRFPDYNTGELMQIYALLAKNNGYSISGEAWKRLPALIERDMRTGDRRTGNGRYVRNLFEKSIQRQADRVVGLQSPDERQLRQITEEDLCAD